MKNVKYGIVLFAIIFIANVQNIRSAAMQISEDKQLEKAFISDSWDGNIAKVEDCLTKNVNINATKFIYSTSLK